jgi:hypothetical protein
MVHLVAHLEEMPVTETLESVTELRGSNFPVGTIVINAATEPRLPASSLRAAAEGRLDRERLATGLAQAGVDPEPELVAGLARQAEDHAARVVDEQAMRVLLTRADLSLLTLPRLVDGVDLGGLYELADVLAGQGVK